MNKKQTENISKRQSRKEELRKKERQQQMIVIGAIALIAIVFVAILALSKQKGETFQKAAIKIYQNANGTAIGDPNAKVKIDVFEDFQCIHCKDFTESVEPLVISQLVDTGRVYYVFHQNPFLDDPNGDQSSHRAALASECAAEQNDFWNYKSEVFANYTGIADEYSEARLETFANYLKLNMAQFKACLTSAKYQAKLDEGLKLGEQMGVKGTPSVFVNGVSVLPGFDEILQAVKKAEQGG